MANQIPNVAHVVISLRHGGLEQCALQWCAARNRRFPGSTMIVCLDDAGPLAADADVPVVSLHANRSRLPWDNAAVSTLKSLIRQRQIDVVHSHNTAARQYASLALRRMAIRHVYTDHGTNLYLRGCLNRIRLAFMKRHTHAVVAVSDSAARQLAAAERIPEDHIRIILNGVETRSESHPAAEAIREKWSLPEKSFMIGYVGRLAAEKGVDRLIQAFADIVHLPPSVVRRCAAHSGALRPAARRAGETRCKLVIVGDGPERTALERLAAKLNIQDRIRFLGALTHARFIMPAFDLFVLPSRSEGLPLALLEAMAESVPVAATAVGECANVLDEGRLGWLLPDDEHQWPNVLARCICEADSASIRDRTKRARQRIELDYAVERTIDKYEALYCS